MNVDIGPLPLRLQQFHDLSLKLISLAEKGRVISDYYEDVSKLLIDFSGAEYISIIARGAHSYFRFCYSLHQGWEMSQLDGFPDSAIKKGSVESFSDLANGKCSLDRIEELVFLGSVETSDYLTGCGGLKIILDSPTDDPTLSRSLLILPVRNQTERVGTITLGWQDRVEIDSPETELYQYLFDIIGFSRSHRQAKFLLAERIKELKTIYQINRIGSELGKSLEDIMLGIVDIIPPGFLHPDFTCCKIVYANHTFKSSNYKKPIYTLKEDILAGNEIRGYVEVGYMRESGSIYKDPFLKEEQPMLFYGTGEKQ